jgi:hypothetical protein
MTKRVFKLRCDNIGPAHTRFTLFDPAHANCGSLTILTSDLTDFVYYSWKGRVDWNERARKSCKRKGWAEGEFLQPSQSNRH